MASLAEFAFAFSAVTNDDPKAIVRGLKRRDPELLDRLIEQYLDWQRRKKPQSLDEMLDRYFCPALTNSTVTFSLDPVRSAVPTSFSPVTVS